MRISSAYRGFAETSFTNHSVVKQLSTKGQANETLFSYGTLRLEDVQLATFGRRLEGAPDALSGYRLVMIKITDEEFVVKSGTADHRNLQFTGNSSDVVEGMAFKVTTEELSQADAYEPEGYVRVKAPLKSGVDAWIFVHRNQG